MFGLRDRNVLVTGRSDPAGDDHGREGALPYRKLLARQLRVHCWLRFGVTALIVAGTFFAAEIVGVEGLPVAALLLSAALIGALNVVVQASVRYLCRLDPNLRVHDWFLALRHTTIVVDYLALTMLIHLLGGARSPFLAAFLLHIVLGCMMASRYAAYLYAALAVLLVNGIVFGELCGVWVPVLPEGAVVSTGPLEARYAVGVAAAYSFLFLVTTLLLTALADSMRRLERDLVRTNAELATLSEARRDFLHVVLHNLKSPLAACEMLLNNLELAGPLVSPQRELVVRVQRRLADSEQFLRDLSVLAGLEAPDLLGENERAELDTLLATVVNEQRELASGRGQKLEVEVGRGSVWVRGNARLLREAIVNLISNAIKYTPRNGRIRLRLTQAEGFARVAIEDEGPGIPEAQRARLFREFVRLGTVLPDGERPPGTGLGLSIVKRIAEITGGRVEVESEVGRGSTFTLVVPLTN